MSKRNAYHLVCSCWCNVASYIVLHSQRGDMHKDANIDHHMIVSGRCAFRPFISSKTQRTAALHHVLNNTENVAAPYRAHPWNASSRLRPICPMCSCPQLDRRGNCIIMQSDSCKWGHNVEFTAKPAWMNESSRLADCSGHGSGLATSTCCVCVNRKTTSMPAITVNRNN